MASQLTQLSEMTWSLGSVTETDNPGAERPGLAQGRTVGKSGNFLSLSFCT